MTPLLFRQLLLNALQAVPREYYGSRMHKRDLLLNEGLQPGTDEYRRAESRLFRLNERVFCYELYYHLRCALEEVAAAGKWNRTDVFLQCELRKEIIPAAVAEHEGVRPLSRSYMPDFLLHTPNEFREHLVVMEVKADPNLRSAALKKDLQKLEEFLDRYNYRSAIFLAVNRGIDAITRTLQNAATTAWVRGEISHRDRITIIAQPGPGKRPIALNLGKLCP